MQVYFTCNFSEQLLCHLTGAITNIQSQHHYTSNDIDTATVAIKAGTNLELGSRIFDNIVSTCVLVVNVRID